MARGVGSAEQLGRGANCELAELHDYAGRRLTAEERVQGLMLILYTCEHSSSRRLGSLPVRRQLHVVVQILEGCQLICVCEEYQGHFFVLRQTHMAKVMILFLLQHTYAFDACCERVNENFELL